MKKYRRNNGIWVLVIALVLTAAIGLGTVFMPGFAAPAARVLGVLSTPFRAAAAFVTDRIEGAYDYAFRYNEMQERLCELEDEVVRLREESEAARAALEENERLRELLKLQQAHSDFVFVSAGVTGRTASSWRNALTLSKGSSAGLEVDMCVVTQQGYLVGVITQVGPNWATVTTLIDPEISVGAIVSRTGDAAVLTSDLDYMSAGTCCLSYLSSEASLSAGDMVKTSGLGGIYPAGLTMGQVIEEGMSPSGMERYAVVTPSADLHDLKQVFVITAFDVVE